MERSPALVRRASRALAPIVLALAVTPTLLAQGGAPAGVNPEQPEGLLEARLAALQEQNRDLRRQLEDAQAELARVYEQLADAQRRLAAIQAPTAESADTTPTQATHDPFASPAGLLAELRRRYAAEIAVLPEPTSDRERQDREREVERWCREVARQVRARREWVVRFVEVQASQEAGAPAVALILDASTGAPIDGPVQAVVPRRFADRLRSGAPHAIWRSQVLFSAAPRVNATRRSSAVFEGVPLIGPGVEFAFDVQWESFAPGPDEIASPSPTIVPATPTRPDAGEPR